MTNYQRSASEVGCFRIGDKFYTHFLFCHEDDRVECRDMEGNVILTFDSSCNAYEGKMSKNKECLGRWNMDNAYNWYFTYYNKNKGQKKLQFGKDLIVAEVELAKKYLKGELV